nr:HNH endonuclease [Pseudomonadota bacterium]
GLDCCDTLAMRDLLLGRRDDVFAFVGTPSPRTAASREWLHDASLRERGAWLTVSLALFASAGMMPYEIVIGRLRDG